MFVVDNESVKLEPLSRDDVLRGIILVVSVFLIFFGFSSDDRTTGIFSLLISTLFLFLLFVRGPISVEPNYLFERYADNFGFYLDNAENYLCKSFDAKKKSEKVLVGVASPEPGLKLGVKPSVMGPHSVALTPVSASVSPTV